MPKGDIGPRPLGQPACDLLVAGAGVAGLWMALKAAEAGLSVTLLERQAVGAGASGGFLGALMPHSPERWNEKKDFQFRALVALSAEIEKLEAATGVSVGYGRVGRLLPLAGKRQQLVADEARRNWGTGFDYAILERPDPDWPGGAAFADGAVFETLSARLSPAFLLEAIKTAFLGCPGARLLFSSLVAVEDTGGKRLGGIARLDDASSVAFGHLVLANGVDAFRHIAAVTGGSAAGVGTAVKGQAALIDARLDPSLPLVYHDGIYVVVHASGHAAVGSTSETDFADPDQTDEKLEIVIARARALCPALAQASVIRRWAGLRPRASGGDPMLGPLPGLPQIHALTGGFKITFGIAHRAADAVLGGITGRNDVLIPEGFSVGHHLAKARSREDCRPV